MGSHSRRASLLHWALQRSPSRHDAMAAKQAVAYDTATRQNQAIAAACGPLARNVRWSARFLLDERFCWPSRCKGNWHASRETFSHRCRDVNVNRESPRAGARSQL
jgi:hypothetical protein